MTKTYILAGDDGNGAFKYHIEAWEKRAKERGDVVVLRPQIGQTIAEAAKQIKPPANIIIESHGSAEGTFEWNKGSIIKYNDLFKALPREGIVSVTINGCNGESGLLQPYNQLPNGTILQARNGSKVGTWAGGFERVAKEIADQGEITPLTILLEALDNTSPAVEQEYIKLVNGHVKANPEAARKAGFVYKNEPNPNDILAHTIGIGGNPPIKLDLNQKMQELSVNAKAQNINNDNFQQAIYEVKKHFDPIVGEKNLDNVAEIMGVKGFYFGREETQNKQINAIAQKIRSGEDTSKFTPEEKRIGYALTVAHMHISGEMSKMTDKAKAGAQEKDSSTLNIEKYGMNIASEITKMMPQTKTGAQEKDSSPLTPPKQNNPRVSVEWNGEGEQKIAKLQAIAEKVFDLSTDETGAKDHKVDGIKGERTEAAINKLKQSFNAENDDKLLEKLLRDSKVIAAFGAIQGEQVANITFSESPSAVVKGPPNNAR